MDELKGLETINDWSIKTHPYKIKVYKIRVEKSGMSNIWYANKVGLEYYTILACKENASGFTAVFRLVELNEGHNYLRACSLIKDIYPGDCSIVEEYIVRSTQRIDKLYS